MPVKLLISVCLSLLVTLGVAVAIVFSQQPQVPDGAVGLDFSTQIAGAHAHPAPLQHVAMRDGYPLPVRRYGSGAADLPLLVLVHGWGLNGLQFDSLANALRGNADVVVPDLRGHGSDPKRRGDVAYIGQLEDDLADLVSAIKTQDQRVVMGGHGAGGGLVVRFAGSAHGEMLDGAVLLAPFLGTNAPMTRPHAGGWAYRANRRIVGLSVLNTLGITAFNDLPVVAFNMPSGDAEAPSGGKVTTRYSYRMNTSFAPRRDYLADVAALPPFLLMAGSRDEAFDATVYAPSMAAATDQGRYLTLNGATHLDIVNDGRTLAEIKEFLDEY